jgi:DNA-binding FrmR family transcriptional regulator
VQRGGGDVVFNFMAEPVSTLPPAQESTGSSLGITDMLGPTEQQALVTRLNRIEGQIRGIRRMVQEPRLCIEILQQLAAAEAALNRISLAIFKYHVDTCVTDGVAKGEVERKKSLSELVDIFDRFAK